MLDSQITHEKNFRTYEIPTRKNSGPTKHSREKISDPLNTHEKKIETSERAKSQKTPDDTWLTKCNTLKTMLVSWNLTFGTFKVISVWRKNVFSIFLDFRPFPHSLGHDAFSLHVSSLIWDKASTAATAVLERLPSFLLIPLKAC